MLSEKVKQQLIQMANEARKNAYIPYSHYPVGAALLVKNGKIYTGCNIENAAYSVTICAERTTMFKAVSEGDREFQALAVVTDDGGSPCGSCRQVMVEFAPEMDVIVADGKGNITLETTPLGLLPGAFTPMNLLNR